MSEEGYLCMITLYAHALIHLIIQFVSLLLVYSMFLLQVLSCTYCFVDLTLLVLFLSVQKFKNS